MLADSRAGVLAIATQKHQVCSLDVAPTLDLDPTLGRLQPASASVCELHLDMPGKDTSCLWLLALRSISAVSAQSRMSTRFLPALEVAGPGETRPMKERAHLCAGRGVLHVESESWAGDVDKKPSARAFFTALLLLLDWTLGRERKRVSTTLLGFEFHQSFPPKVSVRSKNSNLEEERG